MSAMCATTLKFLEVRQTLVGMLPSSHVRIRPDSQLDEIVPREARKQVWHAMRARWPELPRLVVPDRVARSSVYQLYAKAVLTIVMTHNILMLWTLIPFAWLIWLMTRPFAIEFPASCETMREAVLRVTHFTQTDFEAGLWPEEELSAKVRMIVADAVGRPFREVTEDSRLIDLVDC